MRIVVWFTMGFAAACALGVHLPTSNLSLVFALGFLLLAAAAGFLRRQRFHDRLCVLCLGLALGLGWFQVYNGFYLSPIRPLDGQVATLRVTAMDFGSDSRYHNTQVDGWTTLEGRPYRVRVFFRDTEQVQPGTVIEGTFRLKMTDAQEENYRRTEGLFLLASQKGPVSATPPEQIPWYGFPAVLRQNLIQLLDRSFPPREAAFAKALLLGIKTELDDETTMALRVTGISHVIAVSGLHVSILLGLIFVLTGRRRWLMALLGAPILVLFAAMAGFTPSINRAVVMQLLLLLAWISQREYDPPTALATAALGMLWVNPLVVSSVSFQLSVSCMIGIFLIFPPVHRWLLSSNRLGSLVKGTRLRAKLIRWVAVVGAITCSVTVVTAPLVGVYFGTASLIGSVTNLLVLWCVSIIFYGLIAVCLAGALFSPLANLLSLPVRWLIGYLLWICGILSKFPLAAVYTCSIYVTLWLIFCYILLGIFLLTRGKQPKVLLCCCTIGLCLALLASWWETARTPSRLTVLDVGQGQCVLFQARGKSFLIDCGGDNYTAVADLAAQTLLSQGVFSLDGLILTHYDRDHVGAVAKLLTRVPTAALYLPQARDDKHALDEILDAAGNAMQISVAQDLVLEMDDVRITLFASEVEGLDNESSLAVLMQRGDWDALVTGDRTAYTEQLLVNRVALPKLEVLVVGHHGSDTSTCRELLQACQPQAAVISVGEDNHFGHPAQSVLDRLAEFGCTVYRTDQAGTLVFRG